MGKVINFKEAKKKIVKTRRDKEIEEFNREVRSIVDLIESNMTEEEKLQREILEKEIEEALKGLI